MSTRIGIDLMYKSKQGTWFKEGSIVRLIDDYRPQMDSGLFEGIRICENEGSEARILGEEYLDQEICGFDEFEMIDL